jgi:hypothetical protein
VRGGVCEVKWVGSECGSDEGGKCASLIVSE